MHSIFDSVWIFPLVLQSVCSLNQIKYRNGHANMELKGLLFHLILSKWKIVVSFSPVFVLVFMETKANNLMFENAVDDTF